MTHRARGGRLPRRLGGRPGRGPAGSAGTGSPPSPRRWPCRSPRSASTCRSGCRRPAGAPATSQAKALLGRAHPRVFLAPPRGVLAAATYAEAGRLHRELTGRARPVGADLAPGAEDPRGRRGGGRPPARRGAPRAQPGRARRCRAAAVEEDRRRAGGPGGPADRLARRRVLSATCRPATTGWTRWPSPGRRTDGWPAGPGRCPAYRRTTSAAGRCGSSPDARSGGARRLPAPGRAALGVAPRSAAPATSAPGRPVVRVLGVPQRRHHVDGVHPDPRSSGRRPSSQVVR